jgi:cell division protein FtsQ
VSARAPRRSPARRSGGSGKRKQARRAKKAGLLDHAVAALPVSEHTLRHVAAWTITAIAAAVALGVAAWFGIPGAMGVAMAEGIGRAGFRVEKIELAGVNRVDRMAVYTVALNQKSRAMPLVDLTAVRERLLRFPWVEDARVSRRLPDTLVVDIVERRAAAVWQNNGQLMLIDGGGVPLEPVTVEKMPDLPLVIGANANAQEPAYRTLMDAAPALKPRVRAASWIGDRRWDLLFATGERLSLPEGEDDAAKALAKFAQLDGEQRLLGRGYVKFDMRDPDKLVVRTSGRVIQQAVASTGTSAGAQ